MKRRNSVGALIAAMPVLLLSALPISANATCTQSNLAGSWILIGGDDASFYDKCKVVIASTGRIVTSKSTCRTRYSGGIMPYDHTAMWNYVGVKQ